MYKPICLVFSLCLTAFPIKAADNIVSMKDLDKLLKYDEVKISEEIKNDYLSSYMELNYPSSYAALPSNGSCQACLSSCASGSESVASGKCYTSTGSYLSCSTAKNVTCYTGQTSAYADCAAAGFSSSKTGKCGTTTKTISTNPGGKCGSATCYSGGSSCSDSCPSGYSATAPSSSQCATGSTTYTNCTSCGTATCYKGITSCSSSCTSGSATVGSGKCYTGTSSYTNCSSCSSTTCYTGLQTVHSSCANAGYRTSAGSTCNYSTVKIYTGTSNGACGTPTTCYHGGSSCSDSCTSGSATVGSGKGYTGTSNYINCSSCSSTTCYTTANWCDSATYKYTSAPSNGTLSGSSCTGYGGTNGGACSGSSATRYTSFTCNSGYKKSSDGTSCVADCTYSSKSACESAYSKSTCTTNSYGCYVPSGCKSSYYKSCTSPLTKYATDSNGCGSCGCDASVYKYYSPSSPMIGSDCCSGARVSNGTAIGGGQNCKDFTCKSGYKKSGDTCVSSCSYTYTASEGGYGAGCVRDGVTYYQNKCSGKTSCNRPYKLSKTCTDASGKSWGNCTVDYNAACIGHGYSYAIAQSYATTTNMSSAGLCGVTGGYPALLDYDGRTYYYTCCR